MNLGIMDKISRLSFFFWLALLLSASVSLALPECTGSPTKQWRVTKSWHNCHGVYIFTGWGLTEGHTFSGEFQNGERYGYGEWTFPNHVRKGFFIGTSIVQNPNKENAKSSVLREGFITLSEIDRELIQKNLEKLGLYTSSIDALYGKRTSQALITYNAQYLSGLDLEDKTNVSSLFKAVISHKFSSIAPKGNTDLCNKWYNGEIAGYNFWGKADDAVVSACIAKVGINHLDLYSSTPLNSAASYSGVSVQRIRQLLDLGADVNIPSDSGHTPLIRAAASAKDPRVIYLLVSYGANVNHKDMHGETALISIKRNRFGLKNDKTVIAVLSGTEPPPDVHFNESPKPKNNEFETQPPASTKPNSVPKVVQDEINPETFKVSSGTGFYVSQDGHIITNHHVIEGCQDIKVHSQGRVFNTYIIAADALNDLALLKADVTPDAVFSISPNGAFPLQDIIVAGFPFGERVSSTLKFTKGIVSSVAGIGNNYSEIQIDAAIQPGNSGGPIVDEYGNVIAVAVSKLDMKKILKDYGVIPENTNFGVKASVVKNLMEGNSVKLNKPNKEIISKSELSKAVTDGTIFLTCWMTTAQIQELKKRKVLFNEFED